MITKEHLTKKGFEKICLLQTELRQMELIKDEDEMD